MTILLTIARVTQVSFIEENGSDLINVPAMQEPKQISQKPEDAGGHPNKHSMLIGWLSTPHNEPRRIYRGFIRPLISTKRNEPCSHPRHPDSGESSTRYCRHWMLQYQGVRSRETASGI